MANSSKIDDQQKIVEQAEAAGIKYFKEKYDLDVEFTDHQFLPKEFGSVTVRGHVKGQPDQTVDAIVEFTNDFNISSVSLPEQYLK